MTALVLFVLLASPTAFSDDAATPPTPAQAADAVLAAIQAEGHDTLVSLAKADEPDPWEVANELCHRGEHDAAEAFAEASPRAAIETLPIYVAARRNVQPDASTRTLRESARSRYAAGDLAATIAESARVAKPYDSVDRILLIYMRALALQQMANHTESRTAFELAAQAAVGLGWKAQAALAFHAAGIEAYAARDYGAALAGWRSASELLELLGQHGYQAATMINVGVVSKALGNLDDTVLAFDAARRAHERAGNPDGVLHARRLIANVHRTRGAYKEALAVLETARQTESARGNTGGLAAVHIDLGTVRRLMGDYAQAMEHVTAALEAYESLGDESGVATALVERSILHRIKGDVEAALTDLMAAKATFESRGDRAGLSRVLNGLAQVHQARRAFDQALKAYERAVALGRAEGKRADVARNLNNIGLVYLELDDYNRALAAYEESLAIKRALGDRLGIANTANNIGLVCMKRGQFEQAIQHYLESLKIKQAIGDKAGAARTLTNLGSVYGDLGRHAEAMRHFEEALAIQKTLGSPAGMARVLNNMGNAYSSLGKERRALALFEASLVHSRTLGDKAAIAKTLLGIGGELQALGEYDRAREHTEEALSIGREVDDAETISAALHNLGRLLVHAGQPEAALDRYDEALAIGHKMGAAHLAGTLLNQAAIYRRQRKHEQAEGKYQEALDALGEVPMRGTQARCLWGLAWVRLAQGRYYDAMQLVREAVALIATLSGGLAEGEGAGARDVFAGLFSVGMQAAFRAKDVESLAWILEQGRSGSLREALHARESLQALLPDSKRAALTHARADETRALAAYRRAAATGKRKQRRAALKELEEAQAAVETVVAGIQRDAKAAASIVLPAPDDLATIQSYLRPDEALVYYGLPDQGGAVALVVRDKGARRVELSPSANIRAAVDALLLDENPMVDPSGVNALQRLVADPLELGADVKRVLVSPTGRLGYVPFALLFPNRELAYVPSGTTYGLLRSDDDARGASVLALGDPDYETVADETALALHRGGTSARLPRLPATRAEVEAIADVAVLGAKATERGFQEALRTQERWRAVHFACHGLIKPEQPMLSSLALTADKESDGLLTCLEIFRLKVPADLVVLSACETGKGEIYETEGIVGLTRAFMFAGAPRVICSLWKVDDKATHALMVKFYELWQPEQGMGAAAALKAAQAFVRGHEKWEHPTYWAAWVLWGLPE